VTQPFPDDSIERARRYSAEEKQELERQLDEMSATEPTATQPVPSDTDVDLVAKALSGYDGVEFASLPAEDQECWRGEARAVLDALARAGRLRTEASLGEQPHDPSGCHRAGRPHLGPCVDATSFADGDNEAAPDSDLVDYLEQVIYARLSVGEGVRGAARSVVAVLAGRLLPEGAETRDELLDLMRLLFGLYETWWHEVGTYDPGHELVSDGVRLTGIASLLSAEDSFAMEEACDAIEPHETRIRTLLGAPAPSPSTEETPTDDA